MFSRLCFKQLSRSTPLRYNLQVSHFHQTSCIEKDKAGSNRNIKPPRTSKFAKEDGDDDDDDEEEGGKKVKSDDDRAKLEAKRKERAAKKKETQVKQQEIQKKRNEKTVGKAVHKRHLE
jgi:hypothetical protein